jgi:hypothetical protein
MTPSASDLAQLVFMTGLAEDFCRSAVVGDPRPDLTLPAPWQVVGFVTGDDRAMLTARELYFGFLATDETRYRLVFRGTEHFVEWVDDAEFGTVAHPVAGLVEVGFWSIYTTLRYEGRPLVEGVLDAVGPVAALDVVGHSLGGPLAIYAAYDVAEYNHRPLACYPFACPKPADAAFGAAFATAVPCHLVTDYALDIVPQLPFSSPFVALPKLSRITRKTALARIEFGLACNHHSFSYAAMIDPTLADWSKLPNFDCVRTR